ncbi:hypothetical protein BSL82_03845 [Tardibacter chloracetimidivorans]|uniref:Uncharacterized protein n=1 Tax=Tardibacter chloracetimidivorans TaxID=1921510 RepID=A0A1L3ZSH3_9SPHN|nr:hypothetical protein [Tardibacter chloracetimidivorans]API58550.1 hypothetical protein BSL82_03845 [Tardibacter chloracetimidivorans]
MKIDYVPVVIRVDATAAECPTWMRRLHGEYVSPGKRGRWTKDINQAQVFNRKNIPFSEWDAPCFRVVPVTIQPVS